VAPLVNRPCPAINFLNRVQRIHFWIPSGNGAVFGDKYENGRQPLAIAKSELPIRNTPVGVPVVPGGALLVVGMVTTSGVPGGKGVPSPL